MTEQQIRQEISSKGWQYNSVSCWLVENGVTPYRLSEVAGLERSVVSRWVHSESLPAFVQFAFVAFRKMSLSKCYNVLDCF